MINTIFADAVDSMHVLTGVARIQLCQMDANQREVISGQLVMPISAIPDLMECMSRLIQSEGNALPTMELEDNNPKALAQAPRESLSTE